MSIKHYQKNLFACLFFKGQKNLNIHKKHIFIPIFLEFRRGTPVYNPGALPPGLTVEKLLTGDYVSSIRNRKIADMFKEIGLIEKYGTGIRRILNGFVDYDLPEPRFEEIGGGFRVTAFRSSESEGHLKITPEVAPEVERLLSFCLEPKSRAELQEEMGLTDEKHFRTAYLKPSLDSGLIERTQPDKPRSRFQKYRITEQRRRVLKKRQASP